MVAALIGMILLAIVFLIEELWMRFEPDDPPQTDSMTNAFLEKRYSYICPCGKTMVTYDPYVLSYRCLSCRIARATRAIRPVLAYFGLVTPQPHYSQSAATAVTATTDVGKKH